MASDDKRRSRTHAGDEERVAIGRPYRTTPARGIPVEVDPEVTPPPQLPPPPEADGDTGRLDRVELGLERLADGLGQVWPARHDAEAFARYERALDRQGERIDKLVETAMETHALLGEFVMPAIKAAQGRIDLLLTDRDANRARTALFWEHEWPAAVDSLKGLGTRLDRMERMQEDQGRALGALGAEVKSAAAVGSSLEVRVTALEQGKKAELAERDKTTAITTATKARDRWWLGFLAAAGAAVFEGAKAAVDYFRH